MKKPFRARVALVGLGPIGIEVGKALVGRPNVEILGAADPAADKAGRTLGEVLGGPAGGPPIDAMASALYGRSAAGRAKTDVVILCTGSRLESVTPQIEEAIDAGFHVVSTCEELSFPELKSSALGRRIDERAKAKRVAPAPTGSSELPGMGNSCEYSFDEVWLIA